MGSYQKKIRKMRCANSVRVIQVPYFDDDSVNDVHTALQGFISEVEFRPKVTPVSCGKINLPELVCPQGRYTYRFVQLWEPNR